MKSHTRSVSLMVFPRFVVFCEVQTYSYMESGFFYKTKKENVVSDDVMYASVLTLYTLTSVCIFSILFSIHFLRG